MSIKTYFGLIAIILISACSNTSNKTTETISNDSIPAKAQVVKVEFSDENLNLIYADYLTLKDALVATNFDEATKAAQKLNQTLKSSDQSLQDDAAKIAEAKEIGVQRKVFTTLSNQLIALFKKSELKAGKVFVQHCPMANEGEGGDWLSSENKIQNPYYGSEMMECGAVIEEINSTKK